MDKTKGEKTFEVSKPYDTRRKKGIIVESSKKLKHSIEDAS